jgi:FkbM family methyltransferase
MTPHHNPLSPGKRVLQAFVLRLRPAFVAEFFKRALASERIVVNTTRGCFWVDPMSQFGRHISRHGSFDIGDERTIEKYLPVGGTFVDLGANEGYFTVIGAKKCGPNGRVVAVEPQAHLHPVIAENLRLNGTEAVRVLGVAVSDKVGTIEINLAANNGASGVCRSSKYCLPRQQVAARTLAQILDDEQLNFVDLMKVDIEGSEYEAVMGSPEVFKRH